MKKVFLFDFDGVVIDSLKPFYQVLKRCCQKYGFRVKNVDEFLAYFDGNLFNEMEKAGFPSSEINNLMDDLQLHLASEYPDTPLFAGMGAALNDLCLVGDVYIISSSISKVIEDKLTQENIVYVKKVLGADRGVSKVEKIERIRDLYGKAEYYYIGDTVGDMLEGKKAKVTTVAVAWGWHPKARLQKVYPDYIADSPSSLVKILSVKPEYQ